jgi:hypothetical protein
MTYAEYSKYMANRADIIRINAGNRIKGLPALTVPEKIEPPKVRVAYSKLDDSYMGRLSDDDEIPEDCYAVLEPAMY